MDVSLESLLALVIEASGGSIVITRELVENTQFDGRVLAVIPDHINQTITLTLEEEEEIDEFVEGQAFITDSGVADEGN